MQIEFIYTFNDDREQEILQSKYNFTKDFKAIMKSEKSLKKFALDTFSECFGNEDISKQILKISCLIFTEKEQHPSIPKWHLKCSGKLWFEENRK